MDVVILDGLIDCHIVFNWNLSLCTGLLLKAANQSLPHMHADEDLQSGG